MRICYVADIQNPHTRRWAGDFAELGHEVLVLTDYAAHLGKPAPDGVQVASPDWNFFEKVLAFKIYPKPFGNNRWKYLPYRRALGNFRPDLIHGMEAIFNGYTTAHLGGSTVPRVLSPWGNDIFYDPFQSDKAYYLVHHALHHVDHITGNMPGLPNYLREKFDVAEEKVTPFSWGVDLKVFNTSKTSLAEQWRKELGVPPHGRVIFSPRNFSAYWGVETIVHAIPHIVEKMPNAFFVFLMGNGDAELLEKNLLWLKWKQCAHHVQVIREFLPKEKLAALFQLAEVFVSIPETDFLAQTLLEGMACGCVPICRNLAVYDERVQEGITGRYVSPPLTEESLAATVLSALSGRDGLMEMSANAANQAIRLDDDRVAVRKMAELYRRISGSDGFLENL